MSLTGWSGLAEHDIASFATRAQYGDAHFECAARPDAVVHRRRAVEYRRIKFVYYLRPRHIRRSQRSPLAALVTIDQDAVGQWSQVAALDSLMCAAITLDTYQRALSPLVRSLEVVRHTLLERIGRGVTHAGAGQRMLAHEKGILQHAACSVPRRI